MPSRLTPLEVSLLALDTARTPAQVGTVAVFRGEPGGFDYEALIGLIRQRIAFAPRYRQRVRAVPARVAGPVWVDDDHFDLTYHVRRSALPRPGTAEQLREFAGRVLARRLDRSRPLWEMYLVEGLESDQFALVTKAHLCLVDGIDTVDLVQVLLDPAMVEMPALDLMAPDPLAPDPLAPDPLAPDPLAPDPLAPDFTVDDPAGGLAASSDLGSDSADAPGAEEPASWRPLPEPTGAELLIGALWESARDPTRAVDNTRAALTEALGTAVAVGEAVGGLGAILGRVVGAALQGGRPPADSPLAGSVGEQRRVATVAVPLADLKAVRDEHRHTINDVVLAAITGGLRSWLLTRGEAVTAGRSLTALVPMSVAETDDLPTSLGSQVAPHLQTLPIGEPNALMRLHQVAYDTQTHKDTGRAVAARSLADIAGFAPTTLHALGVRTAAETVRRPYDLVITNVPGPQVAMYAAGSRLIASYPVLPLGIGHLLALGATSYDGEVFLGLTADRDAVPDLDVLAQCLSDAVAELVETTARGRQPTRKATAAAKRAAATKAASRQEAAALTGNKRVAVRKLATTTTTTSSGSGRRRATPKTGSGSPRDTPPGASPGEPPERQTGTSADQPPG